MKLSEVLNYIQHGIKKSNKVIKGMFIQTKENLSKTTTLWLCLYRLMNLRGAHEGTMNSDLILNRTKRCRCAIVFSSVDDMTTSG